MQKIITKNYAELSQKTAEIIAECIKNKPNAVICIASGDTPLGAYKVFAEMAKNQGIDFSQCTFVGLDEWVGMNKNDEGSCGYYLYRDLFNPLEITEDKIYCFDGKSADLQAECSKIDEIIIKNGGLDLLLVGIGLNGHIAMNEPNTSFDLYCHISQLAQMTIEVGQKYFKSNTPLDKGITIGLKHLQEAKHVILAANGEKKAAIIKQVFESEISEELPATILRKHHNSVVILDESAARLLNN
jgi:glucosamine-6-phosphate isomerase